MKPSSWFRAALAAAFLLGAGSAFAAVTITTTSKTFAKEGGAASVSTGGDGTWTATTSASWITLNRASGDAGVSCVYVVSANYSADTRSATIDIGGNAYTVTQTGYTATISPTSVSKTYSGGSGTITVTCDAGVSWTAKANASWLSVSPTSGTSNGSVTYTVAHYSNGTTTRTGSITIAGQTFTVSQTGTDVTISPTSATRDYAAGVIEVTVSALSTTSWTITPNASWISVVDSGYGYGNSTIMVAVGENPSVATRTGTVSIGSKTFTITQKGMTNPVLSITPTEATASPVGAYGNVAVYATPDAPWTAESLSPWITISEGASGAGNGNIKYVAAANPTLSTRTGRIKVTPPHYTPEQDIYAGLVCKIDNVENTEGGPYRFLSWSTSSTAVSAPLTGYGIFNNFNDFNDALNSPLLFTTYSDGGAKGKWYVVTDTTKDGMALRSGTISGNYSSSLRTTVIGPGTLKFWYKVSSDSYDKLKCMVDGAAILNVGGTSGSWTQKTQAISGNGSHEIIWQYSKDYSGADGSDCGWLDQVTWTPSSSGLATSFDGSSPLILNGAPFLQKEDNTFSLAVSFKVGELGRVNRLLQVGGKSVYLDTENRLVFETTTSNWKATSTSQLYTLVLRHDAAGKVALYAGNRNTVLKKVLETSSGTILNFTGGNVAAGQIVLGKSTKPSAGNLTNGKMENLRIWTRALTGEEAGGADILLGSFYDCAPTFVPSGKAWNYFPLDGNLLNNSSADATPHLEGATPYGETPHYAYYYAHGVGVAESRHGLAQRALSMPSGATNVITLINSLFGTSETSATYSFWFMLDTLPSSGSRVLMTRGASSGRKFEISVLPSGAVKLFNNGSESTFSTRLVEPKKWHMMTLAGVSGQSLQLFLDDVEIGNVSSTLSIGYTSERQYLDFGNGPKCIDDLSIFHASLTSAQVRQLYEAGKVPFVYHTVTQGVIDPVVSPNTVSFDAAGGSTNVQLTVAANTQWTATSGASWITVTSSSSSAGRARVAFDVAANESTESRTGTLTLAGKTVTVKQDGLWSQLTYDGTVFSETSDSGFIDVQVEGNGTWTASTDASWLTLLDDGGRGSGSVMFVVDDFDTTVASRTAAVTIAGKTVYITQRGYQLSIDPAVAEIGSNAGAGEVGISAPVGAIWEAIVTADWITLVGGSTGSGSGTLRYTVADNTTGGTRTGKIVISGQEYTVTQLCSLKLETAAEGEGTVAGAGNYDTNEQATLTATPAAGYAFTHWSGDAVGVEPTVSFTMDTSKKVTAHFIPEGAAQRLAEEKAAQGGFYTREQIHAMELGNVLFDVDSSTGKARIGVKLMSTDSLSSPDWKPVSVTEGDLDVGADGSVGIHAPATGNAKFFRVVSESD